MTIALLAARLLLAAVFLVAGLAKLADRAGSRQALVGFGVPALLAAPFGLLLSLAEIAAAVALVPRVSARWGALSALALLVLFCLGIAVSLARGRAPDCHCFGQLHSAPAGWPTLARNGLLAVVAAFVVWQGWDDPGQSAVGWLGRLSGVEAVSLVVGVVALALVLVEGWLLLNLLQQNGRLLARVDALEAGAGAGSPAAPAVAATGPGLPVGSPAPAFQLPGLYGETLTLDALRAPGKPVMLVFSDSGCGPCNALMPEIARWQREEAAKLTVALLSRGTPEANRAKSAEHGLTQVLLQRDREIAEAYQSHGTPGAVIVRPDGTIGSPLAQGAEQIRGLVARTTGKLPMAAVNGNGNGSGNGNGRPAAVAGSARSASAGSVGSPAPAIQLPGIDGKTVDLCDFRGEKTLILFWNPGCGFCQRMLDDLKAWEARPPAGAPKLLVVSTGTVDANRAHGLRAPIGLDSGFSVGRSFGASGTPSAVLVDGDGRIASQVAVGAPGVMALARNETVGADRP